MTTLAPTLEAFFTQRLISQRRASPNTIAALRHPEHAGLIQRVQAIPAKRTDRTPISYLTRPEIDALIDAPSPCPAPPPYPG